MSRAPLPPRDRGCGGDHDQNRADSDCVSSVRVVHLASAVSMHGKRARARPWREDSTPIIPGQSVIFSQEIDMSAEIAVSGEAVAVMPIEGMDDPKTGPGRMA